jgi:hypothetical protein
VSSPDFEAGVEVRAGAGSALVVDLAYNDFYFDLAQDVSEHLRCDPDDLLFLENLQNGGEHGAGRSVLAAAIALARGVRRQLVVFAQSEREGGQDKLRRWYESTGLVERVRTRRGTCLSNVFVDLKNPVEIPPAGRASPTLE